MGETISAEVIADEIPEETLSLDLSHGFDFFPDIEEEV